MRNLWHLLGVSGLVLGFAGCGGSNNEFDSLVDEVWLDVNAGKLVNATEYLRGDGWHYSPTDETNVDRDLVIPLCLEIEQQHSAKCYGILYDDDSDGDFTSEILVKLSPSSNRTGIRKAIEAADARFDGSISQMWGNKWLAFSFDDQPEE